MLTYASVMRLFENFDGQFYDILVEQDRLFPSTLDVGTVSDFFGTNIHPCWDQCNGQRFLNELGAVTLIVLHIYSMISFGGSLEECLPCLFDGWLVEGKVTERVQGALMKNNMSALNLYF